MLLKVKRTSASRSFLFLLSHSTTRFISILNNYVMIKDRELLTLTEQELDTKAIKEAVDETITHAIALATQWTQEKSKDYKPFKPSTL